MTFWRTLDGGDASINPAADNERIRRGEDVEEYARIGPLQMRVSEHELESAIGTE